MWRGDVKRWHCLECWEQFDEETVGHRDDGIGSYDYWGFQGTDVRIVEICPTCGYYVEKGSLPSCEDCGDTLTKEEHIKGTRCTTCHKEDAW